MRVSGKGMKFYAFRIPRRDYELIKQVARYRGMDLADLLRELIRRELARLSYLPEEEKKAIGGDTQ